MRLRVLLGGLAALMMLAGAAEYSDRVGAVDDVFLTEARFVGPLLQ